MSLMRMAYKGFTWPENPCELRVRAGRRVGETPMPGTQATMDVLGDRLTGITGRGYFAGASCFQLFAALQAVYREPGPGCLQLPGQPPMVVVMDSLDLIGVQAEQLLEYAFSFTEAATVQALTQAQPERQMYEAAGGETLWHIAGQAGTAVDTLLPLNPHIRDILALEAGERVYLS